MLVLSRKTDEKIVIGESVVITVVEVRGDTVKLGIDAPSEVKIYRAELFDAIRKANIEASKQPPFDLGELERKVRGSGGKNT
jgi:carbon storage regulator